jgi:hypothetical protein
MKSDAHDASTDVSLEEEYTRLLEIRARSAEDAQPRRERQLTIRAARAPFIPWDPDARWWMLDGGA